MKDLIPFHEWLATDLAMEVREANPRLVATRLEIG